MQAVLAGMLVYSIGSSPCLQRPVCVWQVHVSIAPCCFVSYSCCVCCTDQGNPELSNESAAGCCQRLFTYIQAYAGTLPPAHRVQAMTAIRAAYE